MRERSKKMAVIQDVAKASGVSVATVSQVLGNNTRPVSAVTRERVLEAARALNYHPNAMARGLAQRRTNTVGLVFLHTHQPLHRADSFVPMMDGVLERATLLRLDTLVYTSYSWSDREQHVSALLDRRCDGLILAVPSLDNAAVPALKEHDVPFVILAGSTADPAVTTVDTNNEAAACELVGYLADLGHRRIGFLHLAGDENFSYSRDRCAGYLRAHYERGLPCEPSLRKAAASVQEYVDEVIRMASEQRPTALFAVADAVALDAIAALHRAGLRVPDDISVVGFDDIPASESSVPRLTTIRQRLKRIGETCVDVLVDQIRGDSAPGRKETLPFELIVRDSAAPPQRDRAK